MAAKKKTKTRCLKWSKGRAKCLKRAKTTRRKKRARR